jgi:hypothetical protein
MTKCGKSFSHDATAVKDLAHFPVPLEMFFQQWNADGTLNLRLRSALALAVETARGAGVVRVGSSVDDKIAGFLKQILAEV